jgi:GTPase-associated protein 1, N-terminal domain type 2
MWAEQVIFTSLDRGNRSGYHVVARSPGLTEAESQSFETWSPSHGALIVDNANPTSINFSNLPSGRFALARTCAGPSEYSGRGQYQVFTRAIVFDQTVLAGSHYQPFALYRDAAALGHLRYVAEPPSTLERVELSTVYRPRGVIQNAALTESFKLPSRDVIRARLTEGMPIRFRYGGDRVALAESIIGLLDADEVPLATFSTSLNYSSVRPYWLSIVDDAS